MKKVLVEPGIKTSLAELFSTEQTIIEDNFKEITNSLYGSGFFIRRAPDGIAYEDDFKPVVSSKIVNNQTIPVLDIHVGSRGYSEAVIDGKIMSLNAKYTLDVFKAPVVTVNIIAYNEVEFDTIVAPIGSNNTSLDYFVWAVPVFEDSQTVDYLPNYKVDGQTKKLIRNFRLSFILTKVTSTAGNPASGLKLCKIRVNGSTKTLTLLETYRLDNRAYIKPELYDFFNASFLKQNFTLVNIGKSVSNSNLSLTAGTTQLLNGKVELIGSKISLCRIEVTFTNLDVTIPQTDNGVVIFITVDPNEFNQSNVLIKDPEIIPLSQFTPAENKIVIGVHRKVAIPSAGFPSIEDPNFTEVEL